MGLRLPGTGLKGVADGTIALQGDGHKVKCGYAHRNTCVFGHTELSCTYRNKSGLVKVLILRRSDIYASINNSKHKNGNRQENFITNYV